jgi:F0F1-type ATP synthase epsilon subunit
MELLIIVNDSYHSSIECKTISFTSINGSMEILDGHANGFFAIPSGKIKIVKFDKTEVSLNIVNGLISILDINKAKLLCDNIQNS